MKVSLLSVASSRGSSRKLVDALVDATDSISPPGGGDVTSSITRSVRVRVVVAGKTDCGTRSLRNKSRVEGSLPTLLHGSRLSGCPALLGYQTHRKISRIANRFHALHIFVAHL